MKDKIHAAKVLIAEDATFSRKLINSILREDGFENILFAHDGEETLELMEKERPDLLLLDVNMPKLSGLDVCRQIRRKEEFLNIPILVQSILETTGDRNDAFDAGATDYVTKPINAPELIARITMHIEKKLLISELYEFQRRVSEELSIARQAQVGLMPDNDAIIKLGNKYNLNIEAYSKASSELGGDIWGLVSLSENELGFYILDVSGHGVSAALNTFRLHQVIEQTWSQGLKPNELLRKINSMVSTKMAIGEFATMLCGIIDIENEQISYSSAAQPNPLHIGASNNSDVIRCSSDGPLVGVAKNMNYDLYSIPFKSGESFFVYSDALIETKNHDGVLLGEDGIHNYVSNLQKKINNENYLDPLIRFFNENHSSYLKDDLTLLNISNVAGR